MARTSSSPRASRHSKDAARAAGAVPDAVVVSQRARLVTAAAVSATGLFLVRRIPRPLRPPVEMLLAATAPVVARQLSQLGL